MRTYSFINCTVVERLTEHLIAAAGVESSAAEQCIAQQSKDAPDAEHYKNRCEAPDDMRAEPFTISFRLMRDCCNNAPKVNDDAENERDADPTVDEIGY